MSNRTTSPLRQYGAALRIFIAMTVILGLIYPLLMTLLSQSMFNANADGSLIYRDGEIVGSDLIGQEFTRPIITDGQPTLDSAGNPAREPDPAYFQSRPSVAGEGYDPLATSASNLGPENDTLIREIERRRAFAADFDGIPPQEVAPDALLASGSGLDPHISPTYARQQVSRVASERGLAEVQVHHLVDEYTQRRVLGFLGEPRVNVLELNLALDELDG